MSSLNDKATVDEIIAANGTDGITHIIEYQNIFNGATTWKLCSGAKMFEYAMAEGAFINPKLVWSKKQKGLGDF
tara:strand:+ start:402 stop:623 length:222 start_codon:yes stop_codon:yes gene_type:complete